MRRYFKYIFLTLITVIFVVSCIEEMESPQPMPQSDALTLVPRVKSFTNQYVTKAEGDKTAYTQAETKITHLAYLIFDSNGNLLKMDEADVQNGNGLTLNKTNLNSSETSATVVMFANVNLADIKKEVTGEDETTSIIKVTDDEELSLEGLDDYSIYLNSDPVVLSGDLSGSGFKGFPMKGNAENVNLTTASTDPIVVNLQILYAKVYFEIAVAAGAENHNYEDVTPQFEISGYSVHNVSKITTVAELGEEDATASDDYAFTGTSSKAGSLPTGSNKVASTSGNTKVDFTFYMAESCYNHGGTSGIYPVGDLLEDVKQQYKPKLATNGTGLPSTGLATYVTINGKYKDYRGTEWTVNYKVYLGKNSYDDFHVDRNSEYKNFLTIKGVRNNDSYTDAGSVWIDHRVNVSTNDPSKHIKVTRETLIDSHIEVRPLRVDLKGSEYAAVKVILPNVNWIAAERFTGLNCQDGSVYCYGSDNKSTGKRRYFTTTLISDLKAAEGTELILLDDECAWIYFDENTDSDIRTAKITVNFLNSSAETKESEEFTFNIIQRGLLRVGSEESGYYIESYEEYLHTYDSDDKYNLTTSPFDYTQTGIEWGFDNNKKISTNKIVNATEVPTDRLRDAIVETYSYDFFHKSDGESFSVYNNTSGSWVKESSFGTGLNFTDLAASKENIKIRDLGTMPTSAYQYCLSKNKFTANDDGTVSMIVNWYLPDPYELQTILKKDKSYSAPTDIDPEAYYWSSQPSYERRMNINILDTQLSLINEVSTDARAVSQKSIDKIEDLPRDVKNRIRCVYTTDGIPVKSEDMANRIPDGIGGNHTFYMKAWETWNGNPGYFSELPADGVLPGGYPYTLYEYYDFPKDADDANLYFGDYVAVDNGEYGFQENPRDPNNQDTEKEGVSQQYTSYVALYAWPGLTKKQVVPKSTPVTNRTYYDLDGDKEETMSVDTTWYTKYDGDILTDTKLSKVLLTDPNISISFGKKLNTKYMPTYSYYRRNRYKEKSATRTWQLPEYATVYKTDWQTKDPIYTPSGTVQLTDRQRRQMESSNGWEVTNSEGYIYVDASSAQTAGENYTLPEGAVRLSVTTERKYGVTIYKYGRWGVDYFDTRYRFKITYKLPGQQVPHYKYSGVGGCWDEVQGNGSDTTTPASTPPETDELRLYSGNSFTISTSTPNYVITKIRVYLKGGNSFDSEYLGAKQTYGRFVDNILIPTNGGEIDSENVYLTLDNSDHIKLQGMQYSGNSNNQEVWQEWTGSATEVTLALADYIIEDVSGLGVTLYTKYTYTIPSTNSDKSLVIDRIEVKCVKK